MSENNEIKEPLNKNYKVPKLRFDKFKNDNLNCDILSQIATLSKGNGLSKDDLSQDGNKCILYGELYTRYLGYIDTIISKTKTILSKPKLSKSGDIIMPLSGETPTDISNSAVVPEDNVILGGDLLVITPKKNIDSLFLSLYLSNCKKKEIAKKSCGISIIHSHKEDIAKLTINYPSLAEQYYISTFLKKLTKKTDIVLKKIDILKKYKEGMQKNIFDSSKTKEYLILKNIVKFENKSKIPANSSIENGNYILYKSGQKNGMINNYSHEGVYIIANDGGIAQFKLTSGKFAYTDHCICFRCQSDEETIVLCNYLQSLEKKITYVGFTGTGLKNIDRQYLGMIRIPKVDNKKIAKSFNLIDEAIRNYGNILEKITIIKKLLLKQMFI